MSGPSVRTRPLGNASLTLAANNQSNQPSGGAGRLGADAPSIRYRINSLVIWNLQVH